MIRFTTKVGRPDNSVVLLEKEHGRRGKGKHKGKKEAPEKEAVSR